MPIYKGQIKEKESFLILGVLLLKNENFKVKKMPYPWGIE